MRVKLIPNANDASFEEIVSKLRRIEEVAREFGVTDFSIDVSDGTFTPTTVWHEPRDLVGLETKLNIEMHLMIADVDRRVDDWLFTPVKRIIFHLEAAHDPELVLEKIKGSGREAGIAINPETPSEKLEPFFGKANSFLILGVHPGASGQGMLPETAGKVRVLRRMCPECIIGIDGGVTLENVHELAEAGADHIIAASAIFKQTDIKKSIRQLADAIK